MNLGILKLMGILFFVPGFAFTIPIGDCLKARSAAEVREHPWITLTVVAVEILALWGLVQFKKNGQGQKYLTIDEIPDRLAGKNPEAHSNDRLVFLTSATTHILGLILGFVFAWTRYHP